MKKLIVLLAVVTAFNAAAAQQNNTHYGNNRYQMKDEKGYNKHGNEAPAKDYVYNKNTRRNEDRDYRQETDRMHRPYNDNNNEYRNNRSAGSYDRNRRIGQVERARQQQRTPSFGTGVAVGAVAGVLLGAC